MDFVLRPTTHFKSDLLAYWEDSRVQRGNPRRISMLKPKQKISFCGNPHEDAIVRLDAFRIQCLACGSLADLPCSKEELKRFPLPSPFPVSGSRTGRITRFLVAEEAPSASFLTQAESELFTEADIRTIEQLTRARRPGA